MQVILNVYDLPEQGRTNDRLSGLGAGFYHSAVLVGPENGVMEYSFSDRGISRARPLHTMESSMQVREAILIGQYNGTISELSEVVQILRSTTFTVGTYNVIHKNCNDFSEAFCQMLCQTSIPSWVNRAARVGRNVIPASSVDRNQQEKQENDAKLASQKSSFPMPGKVSKPNLNNTLGAEADTGTASSDNKSGSDGRGILQSIFSWFGGSSGVPTTTKTALATETEKPAIVINGKKQLTEQQKAALEKLKSQSQSKFKSKKIDK
jgi:hypothetical protein